MKRDGASRCCCTTSFTPTCPTIRTEGRQFSPSEEIRRAILSHANFTYVPRVSPLEKALFACDELAAFLRACSYVKPGRSIREVETASVKKKLKDKAFARAVNCDNPERGGASGRGPGSAHLAPRIRGKSSPPIPIRLRRVRGLLQAINARNSAWLR